MNVVIPMAGRGLRLSGELPKPLIPIAGSPMINRAIKSLGFLEGVKYFFVCRRYDNKEWNEKLISILQPLGTIIWTDHITDGPACTALLASEFINTSESLIIANCDQIMEWDGLAFCKFCELSCYDGVVCTYEASTPKNSYIRLDASGRGVEIQEKQVISNISLNGIHYWKHGVDFVISAEAMIEQNDRCNGEFYISKSYNYLIKNGKMVGIYHIPRSQHWAVGTPDDLELYYQHMEKS